MIKINSVTTKQGDCGVTLGPGMKQTSKSADTIEFLGNLDEMNCSIGHAIFYIKNRKIKVILEKTQHEIFEIGAMFYKQNDKNIEQKILFIEENIERFNKNLPELTSFLLPNGNKKIITLNIARCDVRRAERTFFKLKLDSKIGVFLNRLSDLLFVFIRIYNKKTWKRS